MNVEELAAITTGAEISGMLPALASEIAKMQQTIVNSVLTDISAGSLTPEIAYQRWIEYATQQRLLQRFNQKVRVAVSVGEKNRDELSKRST